MEITSPVMYAEASDMRKPTSSATSSGLPKRFMGTCCFNSSTGKSFVMSDSMKPGATAFTVMFLAATSYDNAFVAPISAAFVAL